MNMNISSIIEDNYLLITSSGCITGTEEYRLQAKLCCDEIMKHGLDKIIIDERNMEYAPSFLLQLDIVDFYASGELPEEMKNWKIACVAPEKSAVFFYFWSKIAQKKGYDHNSFESLEAARKFMNK